MINDDDEVMDRKTSVKKAVTKTRFIPPILMLSAGAVVSIMCYIQKYESLKSTLILFITMLVFAIIGTVIKIVIDLFGRTEVTYADYFDEDGEIVEK